MLYLAADDQVYDDGFGYETAPPYGIDESGNRFELLPEVAGELLARFSGTLASVTANSVGALRPEAVREIQNRFPIGDVIASLTGVLGIAPCAPCKQRQQALNQFGQRLSNYWR